MELLLVPILILGFLLWQEKRDRAVERQERDLKEIALLNRIQAPEVEVAREFTYESPQYIGFDDDEGFNDLKEGWNGSG